MNTF
ncbi:unnamed protein product, partial [Rotaria magnacalcarata]|jgi:hypothetical protein